MTGFIHFDFQNFNSCQADWDCVCKFSFRYGVLRAIHFFESALDDSAASVGQVAISRFRLQYRVAQKIPYSDSAILTGGLWLLPPAGHINFGHTTGGDGLSWQMNRDL